METMKMKQVRIVSAAVMTVLMGGGCSHEMPLSAETGKIALLSTRASDTEEAGNTVVADYYRPVFLFWGKDADGDFSASAPYLVADDVPGEVDDYRTTPYNTQVSYPPLPRVLQASGYIPRTLVPQGEGDYRELALPGDATPGRTVLMAPDEAMFGSVVDPFDQQGKKLNFRHLQSRLLFRVILKEDFPASYYTVDSVCITIGRQLLAGGMVWDPSTLLYKAQVLTQVADNPGVSFGQGGTDLDGNEIPVRQVVLFDQGLINGADHNEYRELGGVYVLPGMPEITVAEVSARIYPVGTPQENKNSYIRKHKDVSVTFSEIPDEGESWLVTVFIEFDGIELAGQKVEWDKGGNIIIPLPVPVPSN